jgi:hypothetical protein
MTALAIIAVLSGLVIGAFSQIKSSTGRKSMVTDLYSQLSVARQRARARERAQIIVISAAQNSKGFYGFYHFEDAGQTDGSVTPTLLSDAQLNALVTAMTNPPTVPSGYVLTLLESRENVNNGFVMTADAWSGAPPFPWTATGSPNVNTTGGCSFCVSNYGAVAFLPSGRAVFSDQNVVGGFIVIAGDTAGPQTTVKSAIGIAPSGFIQQVEHP